MYQTLKPASSRNWAQVGICLSIPNTNIYSLYKKFSPCSIQNFSSQVNNHKSEGHVWTTVAYGKIQQKPAELLFTALLKCAAGGAPEGNTATEFYRASQFHQSKGIHPFLHSKWHGGEEKNKIQETVWRDVDKKSGTMGPWMSFLGRRLPLQACMALLLRMASRTPSLFSTEGHWATHIIFISTILGLW